MKKISLVILVSIVLFTVWLSGCVEQKPEGPEVITSIQVSQELTSTYRNAPSEIIREVNKTQDGIYFKFYTVYTNYTVVNREGLISESDFENLTDFIESVNFSSFEDVYESERCYGSRTDRVIVRYSNQSVKEVSAICSNAAPDDFYTIIYIVRDLEYKVITNNIIFYAENKLDERIYFDYTNMGNPFRVFRYDDGNWTQLGLIRPCPTCGISPPSVYELKPGQDFSFIWDGTYYKYVTGIDFVQLDAEPGRYKAELCYSQNLTYWGELRRDELYPDIIFTSLEYPVTCVEKEFNIPYTEDFVRIEIS